MWTKSDRPWEEDRQWFPIEAGRKRNVPPNMTIAASGHAQPPCHAGHLGTPAGEREGLDHQAYDVILGEQIFRVGWQEKTGRKAGLIGLRGLASRR